MNEPQLLPFYPKLVRDLIPTLRRKSGLIVHTTRLRGKLPIQFRLTLKLGEELDEFRNAKTRTEEIEEMADLYTVREMIARHDSKAYPPYLEMIDEIISRFMYYFEEEVMQVYVKKARNKGMFETLTMITEEKLK